jgi:hypothetical protein
VRIAAATLGLKCARGVPVADRGEHAHRLAAGERHEVRSSIPDEDVAVGGGAVPRHADLVEGALAGGGFE